MANSRSEVQGWLVWDGIKDFSEGYIDKIEDHLLPDNASPDCQNVVATKIGSLRKRRGQERLGSQIGPLPVLGMHAYYYGTNRRLVVATGGSVYYWDPAGGSYVLIKAGLSTVAPVCFATCVNYMVAFNGVNAPWKWDGVTVSALANAPADGQYAVLYKEKLFTVPKSEPSTLRWSDSFMPESWPASNYWDVRPGDGDVITCVIEHLDELVVFKRRSTHTLAGTSLSDFDLDTRHTSIGCVGPFAAAAKEPYLYFISDEGLCVWNGMSITNLSETMIPDLWGNINLEYLHKGAAGVWDDYVWFAVPEGESTYNNLVILLERSGDSVKFWPLRGINVACFQKYNDGTSLLLFTGDSISGYVNQQDVGSDDFGQPIDAYWRGKSFDIGAPVYAKKFKEALITDSPAAQDVSLEMALDYGTHQSLEYAGGDALVRRYSFPPGSYGRYLSPKLVHNTPGGFEVRGLTVRYRPRVRMR